MHPLLFLLFLLLTFATSVLLVECFLLPARRAVAGIGLFVFWLCNLVLPVQWLALLELAGLSSFLRAITLFFYSGLACTWALSLWLHRRKLRERSEQLEVGSEPPSDVPIPWHVAVGLLITLCVYALLTARMAFSYPDSWDVVTYHYPVALRWLQEGTLRITAATSWHASLPGNVEILDLLMLSTGRERFIGVVQWPGVLILLLACLHLGRRLGASAAPAWPVVTTTLMIPIVANQSTSGYVDLFGTALLFGSLALVLEYCDQLKTMKEGAAPRRGLLVAAGLGCGLAVGTKPVFWLYSAILLLGTSFLLSRQAGRSGPRASWQIALFLVAGAVPSMFWFARATVCTGNPFYPFAIHIGNLWLPGVSSSQITDPNHYLEYVRHWAEWFVYPWTEWKRSNGFLLTNYTTQDGVGGGFATFVMPGVVFAGWLARKRRPDLRVWLFALIVLGVLWWFLLQKVGRFGLPLYVLSVVMSAPFFEVLELRATRSYRVLYVLVFTITACVLAFEPFYRITQTVRLNRWSRAAYYGYPVVIDKVNPGSTILNLGQETLNFALAGSGLTNRVIPSWDRPPLLTAEFLRSRRVDYLVEKLVRGKDETVADKGPPVAGLELFFSGSIPEGEKVAEWRIWRSSERPH